MMHSFDASNLSSEPLSAGRLTTEQKMRLTEILDYYLSSLEQGLPADPNALLAEHSDLSEPLRIYLDSLRELHSAAMGFSQSSAEPSTDAKPCEADARRLGDFVLGRELGRGGMGTVYEARQLSLDRTVALKVLPFAAVLDAKQIARFRSEAQAAAQIHHPHIVPVFAIGVERGVHYYAMQLIDGQSLDLALADLRQGHRRRSRAGHGALHDVRLQEAEVRWDRQPGASDHPRAWRAEAQVSPRVQQAHTRDNPCETMGASVLDSHPDDAPEYFRVVAGLGVQAAEALQAAHEHGVVHRDVKPSNLLLDREGKLWVTDFGLARCQRNATLTRTGDVVGTLRYMSPEQALGQTSLVDHRTDVYSLGVTLYELLTLKPAIRGTDGPDLLRGIHQLEPTPPRKLRPEIPADLESVILKATEKRREDRYDTAQAFANDLRRFLEGRPTLAKPPKLRQRAVRWALRHKPLVTAALVVGLLGGIGFALSTLLIAREKVHTERNYLRAEHNFREAQAAVDRFGVQLAERLAAVPGAEHVRRELLAETLGYYRAFVQQAEHDPTLRADLALTHGKMGTLLHEIGSTDEAITAHQHAANLFRKLAADEPRELTYRRRLALCDNNLALTLQRAGRIDEALAAYGRAIELQAELVRESPDEQLLTDLAVSHTNRGLLQAETNAPADAETAFREAIRLQEQLLTTDSGNLERHRSLAVSYNNLSALYVSTEPHQAAQCYQTALRHQQQAVAAAPHESKYRSELAVTYCNLGATQSRLEQYVEAAASYREAIHSQAELVQASPDQKSLRQDLAVTYNNYGLTLSRLRQPAAAEQAFLESLALHEALVARHPDDVVLRSSLGGVHNNLGIVLEELQRLVDAAAAYDRAIQHQRAALLRAPRVTHYRECLSKHYFNHGRVLRQLGHPDEAARAALARRELWPGDSRRLFSVAEELALASQSLSTTTERLDLTSEECVSLAVETLRQAVAAGGQLARELPHHAALTALQGDARFAELIALDSSRRQRQEARHD